MPSARTVIRTALMIAVTILTAATLLSVAQPAVAGPSYGVHVWAYDVNVRYANNAPGPLTACDHYPGPTNCPYIRGTVNPGTYQADCQQAGQLITYDGWSSNYWTAIHAGPPGAGSRWLGYLSNVFLTGPAIIPGLPLCGH